MPERFYGDPPKGAPEWFEYGLLVMCRDKSSDDWEGPYVLIYYDDGFTYPFSTDKDAFKYARPTEGIEPEWYDDRQTAE